MYEYDFISHTHEKVLKSRHMEIYIKGLCRVCSSRVDANVWFAFGVQAYYVCVFKMLHFFEFGQEFLPLEDGRVHTCSLPSARVTWGAV